MAQYVLELVWCDDGKCVYWNSNEPDGMREWSRVNTSIYPIIVCIRLLSVLFASISIYKANVFCVIPAATQIFLSGKIIKRPSSLYHFLNGTNSNGKMLDWLKKTTLLIVSRSGEKNHQTTILWIRETIGMKDCPLDEKHIEQHLRIDTARHWALQTLFLYVTSK